MKLLLNTIQRHGSDAYLGTFQFKGCESKNDSDYEEILAFESMEADYSRNVVNNRLEIIHISY